MRSIAQQADRVTVEADGLTVASAHVVVTAPPALVSAIAFDPVLPPDRAELYRRAVAGPESKTLVVYDEPFWRAEGLSGQTAGPGSASEVTIDASPDGRGPGVLASFTFGKVASRFDDLDAGERRRALTGALTERLGTRAASPAEIIETPWWKQEWTRGCSMAHLPPGVLTRLGPLLREPFGLRALGRHRDLDDLARCHRRGHPLRRAGGVGGARSMSVGDAFRGGSLIRVARQATLVTDGPHRARPHDPRLRAFVVDRARSEGHGHP